MGALTRLKYFSLRITEPPILDLRACHNLEKLPSDISPLRKLTHLDISECYLLESMPKGVDELYSLQVLKGFVLETSRRSSRKPVILSRLRKLRKLSIYIGKKDLNQEEDLRTLKDIKNLRVLAITWKEMAKLKVEDVQEFGQLKVSFHSLPI